MHPMLVVGSVAFDTIHNHLGSHPKVLGGSATYAAMAGSVFTKVQLVGVVGSDYPDSALRILRDLEIDLAGLEVAEGKTFHWEGRYTDDLQHRTSLSTELNVFADFHPKIPEAFRDTPFVMLGNIDPVLQLEVLDQVRNPKLVVADTMNFWIDSKLDDLKKVLQRIDVLVINDEEARQLAEAHNIGLVAKELLELGPKTLIIKRGEHGAMLWHGGDVFYAPAYPLLEVQDPTGAGDTFAGAFTAYLASQDSLSAEAYRRAVIYGSA
ncbi:MAG: bifunctional hydroxymethylpyrimidine kinase/phosphomethylpyrimidine kinase, partial [Myxococcales bacterium]|nr:bifunctional hydroxymethylpyrimidine kinase/phosphomethylpyrimidine kinase [Myxococcales bacterium]